jgi:acetyltransferase EpsM
MRNLIFLGGGEHARVVIEAAHSVSESWRILGFLDPSPRDETQARMSTPHLGGDDCLARYPDAAVVLGVGARGLDKGRQRLVARTGAALSRWAVVIHRTAYVSPSAQIGAGSVILAGAVINSGARIGCHCIVNTHACIEHDVELGDFVHAAPGSIVGGGARVGAESYLGMGSLVRDHITLGGACLVGMGAVVTQSFAARSVLLGVPARNTQHGK